MDSDEEDRFQKRGGEALDMGDNDFDDSDEEHDMRQSDDDDDNEPVHRVPPQKAQVMPAAQQKKVAQVPQPAVALGKGQQVQNQPFDLAVDVNDSEEVDSEEEEDEVNVGVNVKNQASQKQQQTNTQAQSNQSAQQQQNRAGAAQQQNHQAEEDDDEKEVPGAYNPAQYANLPVSGEVKELFEYIQRFKPQKIDLATKMKPFVPDFVPAVGEVDAFLKMPKPDGTKEDLGITVLDEPALNNEDKTVLELKYVQSKNVVRATPMDVDSIEQADKKPKEIARWISAVQDLHRTRPPPTVNYSKNMPDFDQLMEEWKPEMEQALQQIEFPGADIDMHVSDYARLVLSMCDIPVHKLQNNKSVIESLHVLFTLFVEFRNNQHFQQFQKQNPDDEQTNLAQF